jgi:hypothetical protein
VRRNDNNDTPIPPDLPAARNPPAGAVIDYDLKSAASGEVTIGIYDAHGEIVRQLSSVVDREAEEEPPNVPVYWLAKPKPLSAAAGASRAVWDLRYSPPPALRHDYPISATFEQTPRTPEGPRAAPGKYEVRLAANGVNVRQPLTIVADPRVHVAQADFDRQAAFERQIAAAMRTSFDGRSQVVALRGEVGARLKTEAASRDQAIADALRALDRSAAALVGEQPRGAAQGAAAARSHADFAALNGNLGALLEASDLADGAPTEAMKTAWTDYCRDLAEGTTRWRELTTKELPAVNLRLRAAQLDPLPLPKSIVASPSCTP